MNLMTQDFRLIRGELLLVAGFYVPGWRRIESAAVL